jgi:hypothetical protein
MGKIGAIELGGRSPAVPADIALRTLLEPARPAEKNGAIELGERSPAVPADIALRTLLEPARATEKTGVSGFAVHLVTGTHPLDQPVHRLIRRRRRSRVSWPGRG